MIIDHCPLEFTKNKSLPEHLQRRQGCLAGHHHITHLRLLRILMVRPSKNGLRCSKTQDLRIRLDCLGALKLASSKITIKAQGHN